MEISTPSHFSGKLALEFKPLHMATVTVKAALSPTQKKVAQLLKWLNRFNFLAILITLYLTYLHYKPESSDWCTFGDYMNCDIVNKSTYAEILGIPVAILGLVAYLFLFLVGRAMAKNYKFYKWWKWLRPFRVFWIMFAVIAVGVLFSGYLTYIELFVLHALCILCVAQQIIILIELFMMLSLLSAVDEGNKSNPNVCEFC